MLSVRNLTASYGKIQVLHGVTFEVAAGEIVCFIGSNGAGKTTMLRALIGLVVQVGGEVEFEGRSVVGLRPYQVVRLGMGYVPEGRRIFSHLTVIENLEMGGYLCRGWAPLRESIERQVALFPELKNRRDQLGGTLSGGEQQMLAIARALMGRPRLLLLDEPSMGLAPMLVERIFDAIRRINADGTTVLLVEQNAAKALELARRGYVLEQGRLVLADSAANLAENELVRESYLGGRLED